MSKQSLAGPQEVAVQAALEISKLDLRYSAHKKEKIRLNKVMLDALRQQAKEDSDG